MCAMCVMGVMCVIFVMRVLCALFEIIAVEVQVLRSYVLRVIVQGCTGRLGEVLRGGDASIMYTSKSSRPMNTSCPRPAERPSRNGHALGQHNRAPARALAANRPHRFESRVTGFVSE